MRCESVPGTALPLGASLNVIAIGLAFPATEWVKADPHLVSLYEADPCHHHFSVSDRTDPMTPMTHQRGRSPPLSQSFQLFEPLILLLT